jgi:hypothetical protein
MRHLQAVISAELILRRNPSALLPSGYGGGRTEKRLGCHFHLNGRLSCTDALLDDRPNTYECHHRLLGDRIGCWTRETASWCCLIERSALILVQRTALYIMRPTRCFFHESSVPCVTLGIWAAASLEHSKVKYALKLQRRRILHKIIRKIFFLGGGGVEGIVLAEKLQYLTK